jgi:lycopene cyclase domain-containing protein
MDLKNYTYFLILFLSVVAPIALSFDRRVQFYRKLIHIIPAILFTAIIFWIWDVWFTATSVWSFNPKYIVGNYILDMPIEEWLFFLVIPYCCMFIYEVVKYYLKNFEFPVFFRTISIILIFVFGAIATINHAQIYTLITFSGSAVYLGFIVFRNKFNSHLTRFYISYLIALIPFFVVNGILTSLPVVEYHPAQNLNIRITTIPIEDFSYLFLMHLMTITIYENLVETRHAFSLPKDPTIK